MVSAFAPFALQITLAENIAVAFLGIGAMNRWLAEYYVPRIFQYSPTDIVVKGCVQKPLSVAFIVIDRPFTDLLPCHCELSATRNPDSWRDRLSREELPESFGIRYLGRFRGVYIFGAFVEFQLSRAA